MRYGNAAFRNNTETEANSEVSIDSKWKRLFARNSQTRPVGVLKGSRVLFSAAELKAIIATES